MSGNPAHAAYGAWLLALASAVGLGIAIFNDIWTGNGIHGTPGAHLVVASTALMCLAVAARALWSGMPHWLRGLLLALIALDILGTGFAAYMLEAWWLVAAMAVALVGWIVHLMVDPAARRPPAGAVTSVR